MVNKNGLKTQEDDANNKVIQLDNDLKHFEQGFTVYYDTLPKPITPEYIYIIALQIKEIPYLKMLSINIEMRKKI